MSRNRGSFLPFLLTGSVLLAAGCSTNAGTERAALSIRDFAHPPAGLKTDTLAMSPAVTAPPVVTVEGVEIAERDASGTRDFVKENGRIESRTADGKTVVDAQSPEVVARRVEAGEVWPVEGLVGQVNGRPVFADAFFNPIEDQLIAIAAMPDRVEARRALVTVVSRQFQEVVESELILAEAESRLSPEQQEGLFAWIRSLQEETIAQRGGSRAEAERSLASEDSMSLDDFLQMERDKALVRRLLSQRIEPRTIVSWRDVVQEYERRKGEFNPPPAIKIGRIRLDTANEAELIAKVRALLAEGKGFAEIVRTLNLPEGGFWNRYELPANGIEGLELSEAIKQRLDGLKVDQVSEPIEARGFVSWLAIMEVETQQQRSLYDREVQLALESELRGRRRIIERDRYIETLRSRWVTDDIQEMESRLVEIALQRYWR
ncbi:MAG: hypothetical protein ACK5WD_13170 [bacterium]